MRLLLVGDAQLSATWRPELQSVGFTVATIENPLEAPKVAHEVVLFASATRGLVLQRVLNELSKLPRPPSVFVVADSAATLPSWVQRLSPDAPVAGSVDVVLQACGMARPAPPRFEVLWHPVPISAVDLVLDEDGRELLRLQAPPDEVNELAADCRSVSALSHPAFPRLCELSADEPESHLLFEL